MERRVRYPLGMQTFSELIEKGFLYVDKTEYVYNMTHSDSKYIFLSRPRRFGKSLLTSTLKAYFEARRDLFKGLAMERLEREWTEHPVLHFDLSTAKHCDRKRLLSELNLKLREYEALYGRDEDEEEPNQRLMGIIKRARQMSGRQVVVLIDEYDAPLLDVAHEEEHLPALREVMRNFYSPLKRCDPYLRFVFLTGITKFSQLSIFSELNNIKNISMDKNYAGICGITQQEMVTRMMEGIEKLAEGHGWSKERAVEALKENYDGYHFAWPSPDIYNPFSLLNAMSDGELNAYWFGSGTPTYLIEMLRKFHVSPSQMGSPFEAMPSSFDTPTERMTDITPMLYQSGYITIKDYDRSVDLYTLDIPNREIRIGLMRSLLPNYLGETSARGTTTTGLMQRALLHDDMDAALRHLQTFLGTVPQTDNTGYEGHWQQMLYIIFSLLGATVDVEVRTPKGRVDLVAKTAERLYLIELKMNQSAEAAMNQIDLKEYPQRFALCGLPVVKVGVNFDLGERNITDWEIV